MTAPDRIHDSLLTILAGFGAITAMQEQLHWLITTGAGLLAGCAALLAIYRHVRALRSERRED